MRMASSSDIIAYRNCRYQNAKTGNKADIATQQFSACRLGRRQIGLGFPTTEFGEKAPVERTIEREMGEAKSTDQQFPRRFHAEKGGKSHRGETVCFVNGCPGKGVEPPTLGFKVLCAANCATGQGDTGSIPDCAGPVYALKRHGREIVSSMLTLLCAP